MPARNLYHDAVVQALLTDGWTITHDPLSIPLGERYIHIDIGAERTTIGAERGSDQIAVEIQSFLSYSPIRDLQEAVGQYVMYREALRRQDPPRVLFLAVPRQADETILAEAAIRSILEAIGIRYLVYDGEEQKVVRWNDSTSTGTPSAG